MSPYGPGCVITRQAGATIDSTISKYDADITEKGGLVNRSYVAELYVLVFTQPGPEADETMSQKYFLIQSLNLRPTYADGVH